MGLLARKKLLLISTLTILSCNYCCAANIELNSIYFSDKEINNKQFKHPTQKLDGDLFLFEDKKDQKQKDLSKKFGPLLLETKIKSTRRQQLGFNFDIYEALDLMYEKQNGNFFKTDDTHYILSPDTKKNLKDKLNKLNEKIKSKNSKKLKEEN